MAKTKHKRKIMLLESEKRALEGQIEALCSENQRLREELIDCRARLNAAQQWQSEIAYLRDALSDVQQRSDEMRQRSDTIIMQLTQQLDRSHLQLADMSKVRPRTLWQRLKGVFSPETP